MKAAASTTFPPLLVTSFPIVNPNEPAELRIDLEAVVNANSRSAGRANDAGNRNHGRRRRTALHKHGYCPES